MNIAVLIGWASELLPTVLRVRATPERLRLVEEFTRYGLVGVVGFGVDTAFVYGLRHQLGLYGAGLVSYVAAASATWLLNRHWTFKGRGSGAAHRQWALFLLANSGGFVINRGIYALLITFVPLCAHQPIVAITVGMLMAMSINFVLARNVVFQPVDRPL